jgi:L-alanine-DL-glutamate epimerase-like enolase superfamily enzyme
VKITGYRSIATVHDWGRVIGDTNGVMPTTRTVAPILILETDAGLEGIGIGAHSDIARVFPAIDGEDPRAVTYLYDRMLARVFKEGHAGPTFGTIGAVDMALWDLKAKVNDEALWRTLGGHDRFVQGYASGLEAGLTDDELVALYERFADRGFTAAKIKGGRDIDGDLKRLVAARDVMRRNTRRPAMMFDANESWTASQAIRFISQVEEVLDLTWIEEPVRRWDAAGMAAVRAGVRAGVATGENLTGLEQFGPLFAANAMDVVQIGNGWGITHALRVAAVALAHDLPISPVGNNCNPLAHVASAIPNHLTFEVQDLAFPTGLSVDQEFADGGIVLGDAPGLGIIVDEEAVLATHAFDTLPPVDGPHVRPVRAGLRLIPEPRAEHLALAEARGEIR